MTTHLIDLSHPRSGANDLAGLEVSLTPLVGEPFRFTRVSYGDELTLHFGDLRPARSPKLKKHLYGAYVLGVRGSHWTIKAGTLPLVRWSGFYLDLASRRDPDPSLTLLQKTAIEAEPLVEPGSRVIAAMPFLVRGWDQYGIDLRFSDGSTIHVFPTPPLADEELEGLPALADWELNTPNGLLAAGPGPTWAFRPKPQAEANTPPPPSNP